MRGNTKSALWILLVSFAVVTAVVAEAEGDVELVFHVEGMS